jgi:tetrahydromethanopterin S-methyltransferase subunit B
VARANLRYATLDVSDLEEQITRLDAEVDFARSLPGGSSSLDQLEARRVKVIGYLGEAQRRLAKAKTAYSALLNAADGLN